MSNEYHAREIEPKWQKQWEQDGIYHAARELPTAKNEAPPRHKRGGIAESAEAIRSAKADKKFYGLIEFPYPSGEGLHVGHPRSYTAIDIVTRKQRMQGKNVLYPMGWDAFGLPTENFAIKHKIKPQDATRKNIANFTRQLKSLGLGFDWSREINTTDPAYYKWTQWMFLQFFKHDLAYKAKTLINWCPSCKIGLANEEAQGGICERCGGTVEKREKEQWMIAITKYADRLLSDLDTVDYLDKIKTQQINWIGKSQGATIDFKIKPTHYSLPTTHSNPIRVFTTRPDTLFGATFLVVSPELAKTWMDAGWKAPRAVSAYIKSALKRTEEDRATTDKEKTGVASGIEAVNPATGKPIPIWIADYVLAGYGTGAIMAVPAHDERDFAFAKKFKLPIVQVVSSPENSSKMTAAFTSEGVNINSDFLDGLATPEAKEKMISWLQKEKHGEPAVTYKLRDWVFSRQRYWGEPIPIINCAKCGYVPVPEKDLPVKLPEVKAYEPTDTGESPLAAIKSWVEVKCPKCGAKAKRETDTMPNWAGSSWYFLRYCDPQNDQTFAAPEKLKYWMPVDLYNGGMEHTTLHLLYSRFWYKFLWDIGAIPKECGAEPYRMRRSHGLILGGGGVKMSKSKGNVINPDDVVAEYGADVFRVYEMFIGPFDQDAPWDTHGIEGVKRFLEKVWRLFSNFHLPSSTFHLPNATETLLHQTIKKVGEDIDSLNFNTAVSALMILANALAESGAEKISRDTAEIFLKLLAPFAPHITEELWRGLGHKETIHLSEWPKFNPKKITAATFELVIQVNGKVRDRISVPSGISAKEAERQALASEKVQGFLAGKKPQKIIYVPGRLVSISV
jgi:leucyl-tRNA synthetase